MNSSIHRRTSKHHRTPRQPLDRHLSETGESDGTIYINAGIDSTWFVRFEFENVQNENLLIVF
jgi:hypothetical protein